MALIPTMTLWEVDLKKENVPPAGIEKFVAVAEQQLKAYSDAGGQILFGTDVGYTDAVDTTEEYRLMAASGLTWRQILASLTTAPAERFKFKRKGRVAKGMDADVTVLAADPAADARSFANVAYTISGGKVIYAAKR
jgi:imidazolonepropionase-like amidohydrolase